MLVACWASFTLQLSPQFEWCCKISIWSSQRPYIVKVKVLVYILISNLRTYTSYPLVNGPVHSRVISTPRKAYSPTAISAHWTYRTHYHLYPTKYSIPPESSEEFEGEVPCPITHHRNNVPRMRGEKHDISLKILHQAGFEIARQAATSAMRHALVITPCPSLVMYIIAAS